MGKLLFAINPGSTSTKFAAFEDADLLFEETIRHDDAEIVKFTNVADQYHFRLDGILNRVAKRGFSFSQLDGVVGRGGLLKPLESGTYLIDEALLEDARTGKYGEHASNLGAIMANGIARQFDIPSFIVDPVGVDEMIEEARLSGIALLERKSHVHALNIKAVTRKVCAEIGKPLEESSFVVAHLGGGISVAAHRMGRIVDVNNAENEGPFSPERSGGLPAKQLVQLCYSGKYTEKEMLDLITKQGGVYSYLGTKNLMEAEELAANGDEKARLVLSAMIHQIGKEIGAMATVLEGEMDGIILTGGICRAEKIVDQIKKKISFLTEVFVVPGEAELESLAAGAWRVLTGLEQAKTY